MLIRQSKVKDGVKVKEKMKVKVDLTPVVVRFQYSHSLVNSLKRELCFRTGFVRSVVLIAS